ncbi:MAG: type IX secretion system membrane protein PorP/SprF [Cytophagales bacterium]|nr:MAG: type IX secretion system membrane protein PorP/SprF [Cytophagales bacterium]TAF59329.1 MAG: type IX secretion system membrane protein PorP/SprF [Cytophagales bacterium]
MKTFCFFCCFVWLFATYNTLLAQERPLYSQYFQNQFIENPSYAGNDAYGSAFLTYRQQWAGVENAPQTTAFTLNIPYYENRGGFGLNIYHDVVNVMARTKAMATGAVHIFGNYDKSSKLSMGMSAGLLSNRIDPSRVRVAHAQDPQILSSVQNFTSFELAAGFNLMIRYKFQLGLAFPQLLGTNFHFMALEPDTKRRNFHQLQHFLINARYKWENKYRTLSLEPLLMVRMAEQSPIQLDGGLMATFNNIFWLSGCYRTDYAVSTAAGFASRHLRFGYSYDFHTGPLAGNMGGSHELTLGYTFGNLPDNPLSKAKNKSWQKKRRKWHPSRPHPIFFKKKR